MLRVFHTVPAGPAIQTGKTYCLDILLPAILRSHPFFGVGGPAEAQFVSLNAVAYERRIGAGAFLMSLATDMAAALGIPLTSVMDETLGRRPLVGERVPVMEALAVVEKIYKTLPLERPVFFLLDEARTETRPH
jgi:hypothetical protein